MKEIWKDFKGYEGKYKISNKGRVRVLTRRGKPCDYIMNLNKSHNGYTQFALVSIDNHKVKTFRMNREVAKHFIPNTHDKPMVNHIDGNKSNNCVDNLEWCTHQENINHAVKTGLHNHKGSRHGRAKLLEKDVILIRKLRCNNTLEQLSNQFNVSKTLISMVCLNKIWKHI